VWNALLPGKAMDLHRLLDAVRLPIEDVDCVYCYGSRLWGCSNMNSDWDFIIILKEGAKGPAGGHVNTHVGMVDVSILSHARYQERLADHRILEVLLWYLPAEAVWLDELRPKSKFKLDHQKLLARLKVATERDKCTARKMVGKGNLAKAVRILGAAYRAYTLAHQMAKPEGIVAFDAANLVTVQSKSWLKTLTAGDVNAITWNIVWGWFQAKLEEATRQLESVCNIGAGGRGGKRRNRTPRGLKSQSERSPKARGKGKA
jgi:hypothetical protein